MTVADLIARLNEVADKTMPVVQMKLHNGQVTRFTTYHGFIFDMATPRTPVLGDDVYYVPPRGRSDEAEAVEVLVL